MASKGQQHVFSPEHGWDNAVKGNWGDWMGRDRGCDAGAMLSTPLYMRSNHLCAQDEKSPAQSSSSSTLVSPPPGSLFSSRDRVRENTVPVVIYLKWLAERLRFKLRHVAICNLSSHFAPKKKT